MKSLRASLIHLANKHPELRADLLPLLKTGTNEDVVTKVGDNLRKFALNLPTVWDEGSALQWQKLFMYNEKLWQYFKTVLRGGRFFNGLPDEVMNEILSWEEPLTKIFKRERSLVNHSLYPRSMANMMAGQTENMIAQGKEDPVLNLLESLFLFVKGKMSYAMVGGKGELIYKMISRLARLSFTHEIGEDSIAPAGVGYEDRGDADTEYYTGY